MKKGESVLPFLHGCSLQVLKALLRCIVGEGSSPLQTLFSVVTLDGLRLNDHARVGFLPVLGLGGDGPCHVAGCSAKCYDR